MENPLVDKKIQEINKEPPPDLKPEPIVDDTTHTFTPASPHTHAPPSLVHITTPAQRGDAELLDKCVRCQMTSVVKSKGNPKICIACERALNDRYALERRDNDSWQELAAQQGLELWERQPAENQTEWMIWQRYCSYYPGRVPTYSRLAEETGTSLSMVSQSAQRWNYKVRLLSWARHTDALTIQSRVAAVQEMNSKRISMAKEIDKKLEKAITLINPSSLSPRDLATLLKLSTDMERQAQMHIYEAVPNDIVETRSSDQRQTKTEDVSEILDILGKSGLMNLMTPSGVGVKQTTTTEIVVKGDEG